MQLNFPAVFNQAFGINTNFAAVTPLDDHGNPVTPQNGGSGSAQQNNGSTPQNGGSGSALQNNGSTPQNGGSGSALQNNGSTPQNGGSGSAQQNNGSAGASTASAPNFGSCSTPEIKFAVGLDNRKETAFAPIDSGSRPIPVL
jgi:hypothetical protein